MHEQIYCYDNYFPFHGWNVCKTLIIYICNFTTFFNWYCTIRKMLFVWISLDPLSTVLSEYTILCKKKVQKNVREILQDSQRLNTDSWFIVGLSLIRQTFCVHISSVYLYIYNGPQIKDICALNMNVCCICNLLALNIRAG